MSPVTCKLCGRPKPEHIHHPWVCCGDGPCLAGEIKDESLECAKRQLSAALAKVAELERQLRWSREHEEDVVQENDNLRASARTALEENARLTAHVAGQNQSITYLLGCQASALEENARLRREVEESKLELSELRGAVDAALAYIDTSLPSGRGLAFELGQLLKHGVDDLTKRLALGPGAAVEYLKAKEKEQ